MNKLILTFMGIIALSACTLHKITDKQQLCDQTTRQQVFNATSPSFDSNYLTTEQKQKLTETAGQNC